jgi:hypothetical protein
MWPILEFHICFFNDMSQVHGSVNPVVGGGLPVYHGPAKMEGGVVCRSSAHGGSRMRELDIAGERER